MLELLLRGRLWVRLKARNFKTSVGSRLDDTSKEVLPALGMCVIAGAFTEPDSIGACDP